MYWMSSCGCVDLLLGLSVRVIEAGYLLLEGSGGSEGSTDDNVQYRRKELGLSRGCAADSGISLRFSSSSAESLCGISRQVLTYLRSLQANLNHLKVYPHTHTHTHMLVALSLEDSVNENTIMLDVI